MNKGTLEKKEQYKEIKEDRVYTRVTDHFVINKSGIRLKGSYCLVIEEGSSTFILPTGLNGSISEKTQMHLRYSTIWLFFSCLRLCISVSIQVPFLLVSCSFKEDSGKQKKKMFLHLLKQDSSSIR